MAQTVLTRLKLDKGKGQGHQEVQEHSDLPYSATENCPGRKSAHLNTAHGGLRQAHPSTPKTLTRQAGEGVQQDSHSWGRCRTPQTVLVSHRQHSPAT